MFFLPAVLRTGAQGQVKIKIQRVDMIKFLTRPVAALFAAYLSMTGVAGAQAVDSLASIKESGVLRVGMADNTPSQSKDPISNEWEGFNVDMAKDLAEQMGVKLEIVDTSWSTVIPGLLAGQYDIAMVDFYATPKRAQTVAFTEPYMELGYAWLVSTNFEGDDPAKLNDPSVRIANLSGSAMGDVIRKHAPNAEINDVASDNGFAPHLEVASGRAMATLSDLYSHKKFIAQNPNAKVRVLGEDKQFESTPLAYAVRPGDQNFLNMLNTWVNYNKTTGRSEELRRKWYGF